LNIKMPEGVKLHLHWKTSVDLQCDVQKTKYHAKFIAKSVQINGWPLYSTQDTQFQCHMVKGELSGFLLSPSNGHLTIWDVSFLASSVIKFSLEIKYNRIDRFLVLVPSFWKWVLCVCVCVCERH
jgi:hypothetical protein